MLISWHVALGNDSCNLNQVCEMKYVNMTSFIDTVNVMFKHY